MTTYKSEQLSPNLAREEQSKIIRELVALDEQISNIYSKKDELMAKLPLKTPLVLEIENEEKVKEYRTIVVDSPEGQWVTYKPLSFCVNAKTTKADLKELML